MKPRKSNTQKARLITTVAFVTAITIGFMLHIGIGNACGIGFMDIALLCPLGSLSTLLAEKALIPQAIISLAVFVILALLVGRAFCGWLCPTPVIQRWLPKLRRSPDERVRHERERWAKRANRERKLTQEEAAEHGCKLTQEELESIVAERVGEAPRGLTDEERAAIARDMASIKTQCACGKEKGIKLGTPHFLLLAALITTAVFGFPVFCAVCPVGLTFAFILLLIRLFAYGELTWALIAFPAVVLAELMLLPHWCQDICPLGAVHSLVASANRTWRPKLDTTTCLQSSKGPQACNRCETACPQGIDLHDIARGRTTLNDCIKCGACADACPTDSIRFPLLASAKENG